MSGFTKLVTIALFLLMLISPAATGYSGQSQTDSMTLPLVVWSPPSLAPFQLAFTSKSDIYVIRGDGSHKRQLTNNLEHEQALAWSPDGTRIAYTALSSWATYIGVINADGSGQTYLTSVPDRTVRPSWSPDGTRIAFISARDGNQEVYLMQADGSQQTRLTTTSDSENCPAWSPDGTRIAFVSDRDEQDHVYLMQADGSQQTRLTTTSDSESCPAWSPDGTRIALVLYSESYSNDLDVIQVDTGLRTHLHTAGTTPFGGGIASFAWSPDCTQIAFSRGAMRYPLRSYEEHLYLIKTDGSELYPRHITGGEKPSWSPDGMWIAYVSLPYDAQGTYIGRHIGVFYEDGTQLRLTEQGDANDPVWAP